MSDVINAHDLGIAGGYIIEAAMQGDIDQLKAENVKLQELIRELLIDPDSWDYDYFKYRVHKLGIKVDGA